VLLTRRSLQKAAWLGVWSNSFCGHPEPAEQGAAAVHRRPGYGLGLTLSRIPLALPTFRYRAVDAPGIVENEICPVYITTASGEARPRAEEVMDHAWADLLDRGRAIRITPVVFTPWLVLRAQRLPFLGGRRVDIDDAGRSWTTDEEASA
jgi:isopentenyl-diphosphate delta-isomerase